MTATFTLERVDVRVLLPHAALYGLAAILQESGLDDVRLGWTAGRRPRPWVSGTGLSRDVVDTTVRAHAAVRTGGTSWVQRDVVLGGKARGLMSPRLSTFGRPEVWAQVRTERHRELDRLTQDRSWADLTYLASIGEPCYWRRNQQGQILQDDGASRWEMQPRNQGSEFVGSRLRKLAVEVAARADGAVAAGLDGSAPMDEAGKGKTDSRTATGLAAPGPTDNTLAWCALWGVGQFPTAVRAGAVAHSSGHCGPTRDGWFVVPVWSAGWRPARLRSVLASAALVDAAGADLPPRWSRDPDTVSAAQRWLSARGVYGVVRFPVARFGSSNAPERRAMRGELVGFGTHDR